jgi:hypothetical protein
MKKILFVFHRDYEVIDAEVFEGDINLAIKKYISTKVSEAKDTYEDYEEYDEDFFKSMYSFDVGSSTMLQKIQKG